MAAKIKPVPITTASLTAVLPCQVCGMPGAGLGGLCNSCAAGAGAGIWGRTCPQCGITYTTNDAACPSCMAAMQAAIALKMSYTVAPGGAQVPREQAQPTPLPRSDMQVRDLIGWRVWRITSLGYLRSLTADAIWLPGVPMEASEVVDRHAASKTGGSDLGIHVFAERNGAILEIEAYTGREAGTGYAVGSVLLWGEVVEHERGYRAERAKIKSIDDVTWKGKPPWDKETAEVLGFLQARYGVGVVDKDPSV